MSTTEFGPNVRRRRQALGMTLENVRAVTGITKSHLSAIERGNSQPTLRRAYQIAHALGTTIDALVAGPVPLPCDHLGGVAATVDGVACHRCGVRFVPESGQTP
jgi:transcriptional regulator with XRE-family HTH domain